MSDNQFIATIAIQVMGFLIVGRMAYRKQKGKNEADIEDAKILTTIRETIISELGHKTNIKTSVFEDRKETAIKFNEAVQEMNNFIGTIRAVTSGVSDEDYDKHSNTYKELLMSVEKTWTTLDVLTKFPKLESDYLEWKFNIGNQFDEIEHYMDSRILYNNLIETKTKAIEEYRVKGLDDRISAINNHIIYEKYKMEEISKRYYDQKKISSIKVETASKILNDDIANIIADKPI